MAGHFSETKIYKAMLWQWWQQNMYWDIINHSRRDFRGCTQCTIQVSLAQKRQLLLAITIDSSV